MKNSLKLSEALWIRLIIYSFIMFVTLFVMGLMKFDIEAAKSLGYFAGGGSLVLFTALFWRGKWFQAVENQGFDIIPSIIIPMIVVSMVLVPLVWYFSGFGADNQDSYLEDTICIGPVVLMFTIIAMEARNYECKKYSSSDNHWLPYVFIALIGATCVFGFTGIKYLCKWLMLYSGQYILVTILLVACMSILPIGVGILLIFLGSFAADNSITGERDTEAGGFDRAYAHADPSPACNRNHRRTE